MKVDSFPLELLRPSLIRVIQKHRPELLKSEEIKYEELDEVRKFYYLETLEAASIDSNTDIENIATSLTSEAFVTSNANSKADENRKISDNIIHSVASFFGSWYFIILIFLLVLSWLLINQYGSEGSKFDPFPFAMLGLFLTGLSALQAPFILNSQKIQSDREKIKFDEDYQTNLKAELEIRNLHSKMDFYNKKIWQKLNEIDEKL